MSIKHGNIEIFMGPEKIGAPDDLESVIVDFIDGAEKKLDIAVQELENKAIAKARERVDFAIFTFSKSSGIDDQMILARNAGLTVRGVMDSRQANQTWAATRPLKENGVDLHILKRGSRANKLHHKLMVIDKEVVIAGSFNYTGPANALNDENIIIFGDLETAKARTRGNYPVDVL